MTTSLSFEEVFPCEWTESEKLFRSVAIRIIFYSLTVVDFLDLQTRILCGDREELRRLDSDEATLMSLGHDARVNGIRGEMTGRPLALCIFR